MEGHVVRALRLPDFPGFTFDEMRGRGRAQVGYVSTKTELTRRRYLALVCRSKLANGICGRIASGALTGRKGGGVVNITPVHSLARVRETGDCPGATQ